MPLTKRQRDFAHAYAANSGNGTQAAIAAGFSPKSAGARAWVLLRDPRVIAAVMCQCERLGLPFHLLPIGRRELRRT